MSSRPVVLHARVVTGVGGGPEKTILNSPRFLRDLGYDACVAYLHPPGDEGINEIRRRAEDCAAEFVGIEDSGPLDFSLVGKLERLCRDREVAVWHGHDYKTNVIGVLLKRRLPHLLLATTLHGWVLKTWKTPLYYALDKFSLRRYDVVLAVSEDLEEQAKRWRVPREKLHLIHNAIDVDSYQSNVSRDEARKSLGLPTDRFVVGGLGRLSHEKGFDLLVEAIAQLSREGIHVELCIGGEGAEREPLLEQIAKTGCPARLLGHLPDPQLFFRALDAFALSSRREGLPNVLLEAMAMNVPIISTRVAGVPNMLSHGVDALLCDRTDADSIGAGIRQLAADPELGSKLSQHANELVRRRYSFQKRMERVAAIYDSAMKK